MVILMAIMQALGIGFAAIWIELACHKVTLDTIARAMASVWLAFSPRLAVTLLICCRRS